MRFIKMQGCGNDFVLVNAIKHRVDNPGKLARTICDRRYGIGADGLILALNSENADLKMRIFNNDGSEAEMCGNGIRCFAMFAVKDALVQKDALEIQTIAGIIKAELLNGHVRVDMGEPILKASQIPVNIPKDRVINEDLWVDRKLFHMTCVSMGNPHCVIFVPKITDELVLNCGPKIEKHGIFPKRINAEFVKVLSRSQANMRVYERGVGETLACGTGACASAVAGILNNLMDRKSTIHLLGGDLTIDWVEQSNHVFMTGPAQEVFEGEWPGE